jgi:hypothetical protein
MQPSQSLALALDVCGVALALLIARPGRLAPQAARVFIMLGLAVAGLGLAAAAFAPALAGWGLLDVSGVPSVIWQWASATLGLLLVAAGTERLAVMPRGSRRAVRWLEGAALAVTLLGILSAAGAMAGALPAAWSADGQTIALVPTGWAVALAGAAGVVVANASGRFSGPVPRGRRAMLGLSAIVFAAGAGVSFLAGEQLAGIAALPQAALPLGHALALGGLILLAWGARRALNRPRATDYWRPALAPAVTARPEHTQPPRIVPSPVPSPRVAVPPVSVPLGLAASLGPVAPFTSPTLRRSVLLDTAPAAPSARPSGSPTLVTGAPAIVPPADAGAAVAQRVARKLDALASDLARARDAAPAADPAPRSPLSPQLVAALIRLQTEMARAGRQYEFQELVDLFSAARPRPAIPLPTWSNAGADIEPAPPLAAPTPVTEMRPPDDPRGGMPRPHPRILP